MFLNQDQSNEIDNSDLTDLIIDYLKVKKENESLKEDLQIKEKSIGDLLQKVSSIKVYELRLKDFY